MLTAADPYMPLNHVEVSFIYNYSISYFFVLIIKFTQLAIVCFIIRLLSWMPEQLL